MGGTPAFGTDFYQNKSVVSTNEYAEGAVIKYDSNNSGNWLYLEASGSIQGVLTDEGKFGLGLDVTGALEPDEKMHIVGNQYVDGLSVGSPTVRIDGASSSSTGSTDDQQLAFRVNQASGAPIFATKNNRRAAFAPITGFGGVLIPDTVVLTTYGLTSNSNEQAFLAANSSSNPILRARNDQRVAIAGDTFQDAALTVNVAGGTTKGVHITGPGSTSATSSLRLDNSGGVAWEFKDDETIHKDNILWYHETGSAFNLFLGKNAGSTSTTGVFNLGVGRFALDQVTTGQNNLGIGYQAGGDITTTSNSTYVGSSAGQLATGGTNTALGYRAGYSLKGPGGANIAIGPNSLANSNNTGYDNTAIGNSAGINVTTGYRNVLIGSGVANAINTGGGNIIIGYQSGQNVTSALYNTIVGYQAHQDSNAQYNTSLGVWSMRNVGVDANFNVAVGYSAMQGDNSDKFTGDYNTAVGGTSLDSLHLGAQQNTAVGYGAGGSVEEGSYNTFLGMQAGENFGNNTRVSGGTNNILIGTNTRMIEDGGDHYLAIGIGVDPVITGQLEDKEIGIGLVDGALPNSTLEVGGSVAMHVVTASTSTSTGNEVFIGVTDTSSPWTITIQSSDIVDGRIFVIKDQSGGAGTNAIRIVTQGSELIDGGGTLQITSNYGVARLYASNDGNLYTW